MVFSSLLTNQDEKRNRYVGGKSGTKQKGKQKHERRTLKDPPFSRVKSPFLVPTIIIIMCI